MRGTRKLMAVAASCVLAVTLAAASDVYKRQTLITDAEEAYISGDLPERVLVNANRIQKNLSRVEAKKGTDGIKKKQMRRIEKSAARIERSCEAAGDMLPQENLDARTA